MNDGATDSGRKGASQDGVVLLHGISRTARSFRKMQKALEGSGFATLNQDYASRRKALEQLAEDIHPAIEGFAAGIEGSIHFVGHSMGTIVCQHIAVNEPRLVRSLALFGPLLAPPDPARQAMRERAAKARAEGMAGIADAIVQSATSGDTKASNPVAVALVRELLMRQDAEGYARTCEALAAAEAADVRRIACPVLLVTGDEDGVASPSNARAMAEQISGARVVVLNRCGHWATLERAAECSAALKEFLAGRA